MDQSNDSGEQLKDGLADAVDSERKFRSLVEASPMGIHFYRLESDDRLVFEGANPAADRLLGLDNRQFIGRTIEEAFPQLRQTEVPQRYVRAARDGELWSTESIEYQDDQVMGAFQVLAFQTSPMHMAAIFLDITQRKRDEQERGRLKQQIAQAQKMEAVGRLAGGVAHDFNNLLMAIRGYAELVEYALADGTPIGDEIKEIQRAADKAAALTRQLLAFSRNQPVEPRLVDLNAVVADARRMVQRLIGEDIRLMLQSVDDLPLVRIDPHQVEQIVINLAVNARDAMPKGGRLVIRLDDTRLDEEGCRELHGLSPGHFVMLAVSDTGQGMDEATKAHLFEPFFSTKGRGQGTGLGLATVYGIVQQNGGAITVYSTLNRGTTFCIYLPAAEGVCTPAPEAKPRDTLRSTETILLVEDEQLVRDLTKRGLADRGFRVLEAADGPSAEQLCAEHVEEIDLLLTDVIMPDMNGRALYERLRSKSPTLRVLYMSGYPQEVVAQRGVLQEGAPLVLKPASIEHLARQIRSILDGPRPDHVSR